METKVITVDKTAPDGELMKEAGQVLKDGGLVAFPTETVYGLGGDALDAQASQKIYAAKGRPSDNPLIIHIADWEHLSAIVREIPEAAKKLADAFWPGPLTMIFNKSDLVPMETTGGLTTVAVRMPDHPVARDLIRYGGGYVAAPSANTSGRPSPATAEHVKDDLMGKIDMIVDGGHVGIGLESTIVDLTSDTPVILRPGYVNQQMLEEVLGKVEMDRGLIAADSHIKPKAPGMKYRHYAPKGNLVIVEGEQDAVISWIEAKSREYAEEGYKVGVIGTDETVDSYSTGFVRSIGSRQQEESIACHLFDVLREFDDLGASYIFSESFDTPKMGQAIMNRLLKAAGHQVVRV